MNYSRSQSQWAKIIKDGLVLWYDAYNKNSYPGTGTTFIDISGYGNDGTINNSPSYSATTKGGIFTFDGSNDYIDTNKNASQLGIYDSPFTITVVVNTTAGVSNYFVGNSSGGTSGDYLNIGVKSNAYWFGVDASTGIEVTGQTQNGPSNGTWHVITYAHSGTVAKIYLDGVLLTQGVLGTYIGTNNILIGRYSTTYHTGSFAAITIHNRELTQSEIIQIYNSYTPRLGYNKRVETPRLYLTSNDFNSYVGTGNTWTNLGSVTGNLTLSGTTYDTEYNGGIYFNAEDLEYGVVPNDSSYNPTGSLTLTALVNISGYYSSSVYLIAPIIFKKNTSVSFFEQYHLYMATSGIYFAVSSGTSETQIAVEALGDYFNKPIYITAVASTAFDLLYIYVNGVLKATNEWVNGFQTSSNDIYIGAVPSISEYSTGYIYHVGIYDRGMSQEEIITNYGILRNQYGI